MKLWTSFLPVALAAATPAFAQEAQTEPSIDYVTARQAHLPIVYRTKTCFVLGADPKNQRHVVIMGEEDFVYIEDKGPDRAIYMDNRRNSDEEINAYLLKTLWDPALQKMISVNYQLNGGMSVYVGGPDRSAPWLQERYYPDGKTSRAAMEQYAQAELAAACS